MINIYYTPASASILSSISIIPDNTNISASSYNDITLSITSSEYTVSGSSNFVNYTRVYVKSGSITYASFPLDETNIYYLTPQEFIYRPDPNKFISSSASDIFVNFKVDSTTTSSFNRIEIVNMVSASYSSSMFTTTFVSGTLYNIQLSGSGLFYSTSLLIVDATNNQFEYYTSSANSDISTFFSSSYNFNNYIISASIVNYPYLKLTYDSVGNIPASPTNSIDNWNMYLNISASYISSSASTIYLIGGNMATQPISLSVPTTNLKSFYSYGLNSLSNLTLIGNGVLESFPYCQDSNLTYLNVGSYNTISGSILNFTSSQNLKYFNASNNIISGSIENLIYVLPTQSIETIIITGNKLTGSIPDLSSSLFLKYFDCSQNILSGSILPQTQQFSLQTFICNNNHLTGSMPDLSNCYALQLFDCGYNNLTGSIPELSSSYNLQHFECGYNQLIGSTPTLSKNNYITYFSCATNKLSGSIGVITPTSSYSSSLQTFDCRENHLEGSIPALYSTQLTTLYCQDNQLSTYVSASGTGYTLPSSLRNFYASNNLLIQDAVDTILRDLYDAGGVNGLVALDGTGNSAPSVSGQVYAEELVKRGWTVSTN